jgi:hypothetical protein
MKKRNIAAGVLTLGLIGALGYNSFSDDTKTPSVVQSEPFVGPVVPDSVAITETYNSLSDFVRNQPYDVITEDVFENWYELRSWVLLSDGPCGEKDSHIFANINGEYLGCFKNDSSLVSQQGFIDQYRKELYEQNISDVVLNQRSGYPFAYNCDNESFKEAIGRMTGDSTDYLLSGSWEHISVPEQNPISIIEAVHLINEKNNHNLPEDILKRFFGQIVIESRGKKDLRSRKGARGMMQILPSVLERCGVEPQYYEHRFAQIDCALDQLNRSYHIMQSRVDRALPNIDATRRDELAQWMATHAYHAGSGRMSRLFGPTRTGAAARELNQHSEKYKNFTAEDLGIFLINHNIGRDGIGRATMKYTLDTQVAGDAIERYMCE